MIRKSNKKGEILLYCVYSIKNNITGQRYIGATSQVEQRFKAHKNKLKNNKHDNKFLQESWDKYGEDNFSFLISRRCNDYDVAELEYQWILKSGFPNKDLCYNIKLIAGCDSRYNKFFEDISRQQTKEYLKTLKEVERNAILNPYNS